MYACFYQRFWLHFLDSLSSWFELFFLCFCFSWFFFLFFYTHQLDFSRLCQWVRNLWKIPSESLKNIKQGKKKDLNWNPKICIRMLFVSKFKTAEPLGCASPHSPSILYLLFLYIIISVFSPLGAHKGIWQLFWNRLLTLNVDGYVK